MFVKICGITNRGDALTAVEAGARALGFIFYEKSPRAVTAAQIAGFAADIPKDVWKVGVFVNESPAKIEEISAQLGLDIAQLHGAETPDSHPRGLRVWKAFRVTENRVPDPDYPAEALLLDGPSTGSAFDWPIAAQLSRRIIIAGGLDENNVRAAIEQAHPWGVDVSSRIESSPGKKDCVRMKKFIEAALRS
jgi:phosphoribosylanthranilate isomerase